MNRLWFSGWRLLLNRLTLWINCVKLEVIKPAKAIRANASSNWRVPRFLGDAQ